MYGRTNSRPSFFDVFRLLNFDQQNQKTKEIILFVAFAILKLS